MLTCKACGLESRNKLDFDLPDICNTCLPKAAARYIAEREAARPKKPTLEERVRIIMCEVDRFGLLDRAEKVIAMVREHDAKQADGIDWKARAERAEAKLAAIRSELST